MATSIEFVAFEYTSEGIRFPEGLMLDSGDTMQIISVITDTEEGFSLRVQRVEVRRPVDLEKGAEDE